MGLGTNIKRLLAVKRMSIKELSQKTGIPLNTLYSITRRDSASTKSEYLIKISLALEVGLDELLFLPAADWVYGGVAKLAQPDVQVSNCVAKLATPQDLAAVAATLSQENLEKVLIYATDLAELERFQDADLKENSPV